MNNNSIKQIYDEIKNEIASRLEQFKIIGETATENELFAELAFCLCTPQTKAVNADKAIKKLVATNVLFSGSPDEISGYLKGFVRFHNNKAKYIVKARDLFFKTSIKNKINFLNFLNIQETRNFFFENITGLGLKEASHFLRNIGLGSELAILDRHILKNLVLLGVIEKTPKNLNKTEYFLIEQKLKDFAKKEKIPVDHLDFILWYKEAGKVFK